MQRWQKAYLYPYYRLQQLSNNEVGISATHNLVTGKGVWTFTLKGAFLKGCGEPYEDGTFVATTQQSQPATMPAFLYQEYRYLTAAQYKVGAQMKYAFIFPGTRLKTHALAGVNHCKANETCDYCEGNTHTQWSVGIGCTF
jgi:hypothetical protein